MIIAYLLETQGRMISMAFWWLMRLESPTYALVSSSYPLLLSTAARNVFFCSKLPSLVIRAHFCCWSYVCNAGWHDGLQRHLHGLHLLVGLLLCTCCCGVFVIIPYVASFRDTSAIALVGPMLQMCNKMKWRVRPFASALTISCNLGSVLTPISNPGTYTSILIAQQQQNKNKKNKKNNTKSCASRGSCTPITGT
jgi:hypothetical protein